jgi:hypothetical protein
LERSGRIGRFFFVLICRDQTVIASASEAIQLAKQRKMDCFRLRSLSYGGQVVATLLAMTVMG